MNIGAVSRTALRAAQGESLENKLLIAKKIIKQIEDVPEESSFRLCRDLRSLLKGVTKDANATAEQISSAGDLLARTKKLDPRNQPDEPPKSDDRLKPKPPAPKVSDCFEPSFIDPVASVARVTAHYGSARPHWTPLENKKLLQIAIGEIPLNSHSVVQLWLSLAYDFKTRLKCVESSMLPQSLWITAAIYEYVNTHHIHVPTANCFENVFEELAFRA